MKNYIKEYFDLLERTNKKHHVRDIQNRNNGITFPQLVIRGPNNYPMLTLNYYPHDDTFEVWDFVLNNAETKICKIHHFSKLVSEDYHFQQMTVQEGITFTPSEVQEIMLIFNSIGKNNEA